MARLRWRGCGGGGCGGGGRAGCGEAAEAQRGGTAEGRGGSGSREVSAARGSTAAGVAICATTYDSARTTTTTPPMGCRCSACRSSRPPPPPGTLVDVQTEETIVASSPAPTRLPKTRVAPSPRRPRRAPGRGPARPWPTQDRPAQRPTAAPTTAGTGRRAQRRRGGPAQPSRAGRSARPGWSPQPVARRFVPGPAYDIGGMPTTPEAEPRAAATTSSGEPSRSIALPDRRLVSRPAVRGRVEVLSVISAREVLGLTLRQRGDRRGVQAAEVLVDEGV